MTLDFSPSPRTLRDVAAASPDAASFVRAAKEFVDGLVEDARSASAAGRPRPAFDPSLWSEDPGPIADPVVRAVIHGFAEHLSQIAGETPPVWSQDPSGFLGEPFFAGGLRSRPHLLADTPSAFRRRLVFCGDLLQKYWTVAGS